MEHGDPRLRNSNEQARQAPLARAALARGAAGAALDQDRAESAAMALLNVLYDLPATEQLLRENLPRPARMTASMLKGKTLGFTAWSAAAAALVVRLRHWEASFLCAATPGLQPPPGVTAVPLEQVLRDSHVLVLGGGDPSPPLDAAQLALLRQEVIVLLMDRPRLAGLDPEALRAQVAGARIADALAG